MLIGSIVASFHGNSYSNHDIDIIVSIKMDDMPEII